MRKLFLLLLAPVQSFVTTRSAPRSCTSLEATCVIAGGTGYIGKNVVHESVRQGWNTVALVRDVRVTKDSDDYNIYLKGATLVECDVCDPQSLRRTMERIQSDQGVDALVSCLTSRAGFEKDSLAIDYQATLNFMEAGRAVDASHFVLLSAFCVRKPRLAFQRAKLKFEEALQSQDDMT